MGFFSSAPSPSQQPVSLIKFYTDEGPDHRKRYRCQILEWGVGKLESSHDYIQTLFPLPEASGVTWNAPIIDSKVFEAFRSRPELRENLRASLERMLWFYGFNLTKDEEGGNVKVVKSLDFDRNSENWNSRFDHNHLRITRIIRSLRVLGLEEEALAFRAALEKYTTNVSAKSRDFWRRAAERDLNIRPDMELDDDDEGDDEVGPRFLREYERKRKEKLAKEREIAAAAEKKNKEEEEGAGEEK